jgi:putative transposon-encoded protein
MAQLLSVKIDVKKLDKARFYVGQKGTYAELTISVNDEVDQFGNSVSVQQSLTKEEREAGNVPKNYIGNGKVIWSSDGKPVGGGQQAPANDAPPIDDDLPF